MADYDKHDRSDERKRKSVPVAESTEEAILAFCLRENATSSWQHVISVSGLEDVNDLFFRPAHAAVSEVMSSILKAGNTISESLVIDKLTSRGYKVLGADSEEPADFLFSLSLNTEISTISELDKSVAYLKSMAQRRASISSIEEISMMLHDEETAMSQISVSMEELSRKALSASTRNLTSFKDLFEDVMFSQASSFTVSTGMPSLDNALGGGSSLDGEEQSVGGWGSGRTYVVAAGAGVGKTTTMFRFARECIDNDVVPVIFSLESSKADILAKLISGDSNAKFKQVMRSLERQDNEFTDVDEEQRSAVLESVEKFQNKHIKIVSKDEMLNGIYDIPASVMSVREEIGDPNAKITLFIDYLQLLIGDSRYERQELSDITRELHNMAQSMDIPIIMLSQFSQLERGQRPHKRDLYGSSTIENNADGVLLMWRPGDVENPEDSDIDAEFEDAMWNDSIMMIDLAKNRVGESIVLRTIMDHSRCIVEELSDDDMDAFLASSDATSDDSSADGGSSRDSRKKSRKRSLASGSSSGDSIDDEADTTPTLSRRARSSDGSVRKSRRRKRRAVSELDGIGV